MNLDIKVEKAFNGECIWLRFGDKKKANVLIDSGPARFTIGFKRIIQTIQKLNEEVNLLILTHIDNDHILGFKNYIFKNDCKLIKKIWLNGDGISIYKYNQLLSPRNVGRLVEEIRKKEITLVTPVCEGYEEKINGASLKVIAPKKEAIINLAKLIDKFNLNTGIQYAKSLKKLYLEDKYEEENTDTNKASICFVLEYMNKKIAFLGDAVATDVIEGLDKYYNNQKMDIVKIAHHGSKKNTNCDLIKKLGANEFIISKQSIVHKETIARIANCCKKSKIYCNYDWWSSKNYFNRTDKSTYIDSGRLSICEKNLIQISVEEKI
ncbi:ComEC/Rec2 family competence protein [Clostridium tyrobutyricum]|uniref:ComEC/Rec2 family competence protein n=1 Tax=Clostridium tyrobutyricum TaxID=1519 RepID=UPI001C3D2B1D|nr:MBL fold metallo-hydrolase [Clostridium tyrobutyricum]MBV4438455.1 MBL fold metallo-hydrolase [Clostridium tyrobutyricum]